MLPEAAVDASPITPRRLSSTSAPVLEAILSFRVLLGVAVVLVAVCTVSTRFNDPDLWFHLKLGEIVWNTHSIPSSDTFSFSVYGHPWTAHEWLAELSIYASYRAAGNTGLMLWLTTWSAVMLLLVYTVCWRISENALAALLGALCAWFFATIGLAIRPLLLGYTFLAAEILIIESGERKPARLWLLPPLFAVWVNCHGSYLFGLGLLAVCWGSSYIGGSWGLIRAERWPAVVSRRTGAVLGLSLVALCCNPVGAHLLLYPFNVEFRQTTSLNAIDEWLPTDLGSERGIGLIAAGAIVLLVPLARRSEVRLRDLLTVALAFALAMRHVRMLFVLGLVAAPVLCRTIALRPDRRDEQRRPALNGALMAIFVLVMAAVFPGQNEILEQIRKGNPESAVAFIRRSGLRGPMLNDYAFGGYLIWALPEEKVFIDGRGDVFDWAGVLTEYGRWATLQEDPSQLLNKYGIRFCLLSKSSPMSQVLPLLPGWRKVYADGVATVFAR